MGISSVNENGSIPESNDPRLSNRMGPFLIEKHGTSKSDDEDRKLSWLRSQIIGNTAEFDAPFGKRLITYADHTASGRWLQFIEDYIMEKVLPFYGN